MFYKLNMNLHLYLHLIRSALVASVLFCLPAEASQYEQGVGKVYGAAKSIEAMVDICGEAFPATLSANKAAYQQWREQHSSLLNKIELQYAMLRQSWEFLKNNKSIEPQQLKEVHLMIEMMDNLPSLAVEIIKKQIQSNGENFFERFCSNYPAYLTTENANLERRYAKEISLINANEQKHREKELEFQAESCALIAHEARDFARDKLPSIINEARENHPPVPGSIALWTHVAILKKKIDACSHIDRSAIGTNVPLATYLKKHFELFTQLEQFMTQWELDLPNRISDSETTLSRMQELQRDIIAAP